MSGFVCPKCGEKTYLFKSNGGRVLADEVHVPFLGQIPIDPEIVSSGDDGKPFLESHTQSSAAAAFADVIERIVNREPQGEGRTQAKGNQKESRNEKESQKMRIAVPLVEGRLSMHFGHCEEFAIVEVDEGTREILNSSKHQPPAHEPGALPRWLHEQGVNVIIAGGMGQRAQQLFAQNDIEVVVGAPSEAPEDLVSAYLEGSLQAGDNVCDH